MQTQIDKPYFAVLLVGSLLISITGYSQQSAPPIYPKVAGYIGIVHPIVTFSSEGTHTNFKDSSYFIAVSLPARFGNDLPFSFGIGFQFGISF